MTDLEIAQQLLIKRPPEIFEQYISRIVDSKNQLAIKILLVNLKDQLKDTRSLTQHDITRTWVAYKKVENALKRYEETT